MSKLEGPRNAAEWFKKQYCENCDPKCLGSELDQIKCIAANVLFEIVHLAECLFGEKWDKEAKQAADEAEKILKS